MPESEHPHVLLATLGGKPEIVTFTLDILLEKGYPISEVIVIHPTSYPRLAKSVERLSAEFIDDYYIFKNEPRVIHFRRYPLRDNGQPIDDIIDAQSTDATLNAMDELISDLKRRLAIIHFSISGGRRLMSFLSISAALLNFTNRDHLWHISTPEAVKQRVWEHNEMHVHPEDGVHLIEVPIARMAQPFLPRVVESLQRQSDSITPKQETADKQPGAQRIQAENEQIDKEQFQRCAQVCQEARPAQLKVLRAFARGMYPQEVSDLLGIQVSTVSNHTTTLIRLVRNMWNIENDRRVDYRTLQTLFEDYFMSTEK